MVIMLGSVKVDSHAGSTESSHELLIDLKAVKGLSDDQRKAAYESMRFSVEGWSAGLVVSRDPLAIVTEVPDASLQADYAVKLHVWTGLLERVGRDLAVTWDELRMDDQGAVTDVRVKVDRLIPGYFDAEHQRVFRGKAYRGLYPWAFVPTDQEAADKGIEAVPSGGIVDLYGNHLDPAVVDIAQTNAVTWFPAIPSHIRNKPKYPEVDIQRIPGDIAQHWAKEEIISLMRKNIIHGYEDGRIRPDRTLSRAEFIQLLLRAVHIQSSAIEAVSTYPDVKGHWSSPTISAAELYGIIPTGDGLQLFEPDGQMSRIEMVAVMSHALRYLSLDIVFEGHDFADTGDLDAHQLAALSQTTGLGLIQGFQNNTFRPEDALTRAQAFTVIARLVELL